MNTLFLKKWASLPPLLSFHPSLQPGRFFAALHLGTKPGKWSCFIYRLAGAFLWCLHLLLRQNVIPSPFMYLGDNSAAGRNERYQRGAAASAGLDRCGARQTPLRGCLSLYLGWEDIITPSQGGRSDSLNISTKYVDFTLCCSVKHIYLFWQAVYYWPVRPFQEGETRNFWIKVLWLFPLKYLIPHVTIILQLSR